jgi:hypothetical protein
MGDVPLLPSGAEASEIESDGGAGVRTVKEACLVDDALPERAVSLTRRTPVAVCGTTIEVRATPLRNESAWWTEVP